MLRRRRHRLAALPAAGLLLVLALFGQAPRAAADTPPVTSCDNTWVCITVGTGGSTGGTSGGSGGGGGGSNACRYQGQIVPCYLPGVGTLDPTDGCYYSLAQPQPPAGDPAWQGRPVTSGAIYIRTCLLQGGNGVAAVWRASPPDPGPKVSPGEYALILANRLPLKPALAATAPGAGHPAAVGANVWLWLDLTQTQGDARYTYSGPDHKLVISASLPGMTVTAWVWATGVDWQMGDGNVVHCAGAGTPYSTDQGDRPSPDCGYRYSGPSAQALGQKYQVGPVVSWHVHWSSGSQSGDFDMDPVQGQATPLTVEEMQVLNH